MTTIYEQIKTVLSNKTNALITPSEIIDQLKNKFGTNPDSVILSDYCYNRFNKGISFNKHLFQYINRSSYKYLGEQYPFNGLIFHKAKGSEEETVIGEWKNGEKIIYEQTSNNKNQLENISKEQIIKLYENYNEILRNEVSLLNCKPTELRHLIGRIGEFICAIHTDGKLAGEVNQHGFDVISNGRRISVKTTAQGQGSFITLNQNTFDDFDDLFVVQYVDDDFKIIYYGPKEEALDLTRSYKSKYEIDINRLLTIAGKY